MKPAMSKIQTEIRDYVIAQLGDHETKSFTAATVRVKTGDGITGSGAMTELRNHIHREVLGSRHTRRKEKLVMFAVFEGHEFGHLHCHLLIENPSFGTRRTVAQAFEAHFLVDGVTTKASVNRVTNSKLDLFTEEAFVEECDVNWLVYITKWRSKQHFLSSIDWMNCNFTAPEQRASPTLQDSSPKDLPYKQRQEKRRKRTHVGNLKAIADVYEGFSFRGDLGEVVKRIAIFEKNMTLTADSDGTSQ